MMNIRTVPLGVVVGWKESDNLVDDSTEPKPLRLKYNYEASFLNRS